jgi:hypothetical protein
MSSGPPKPFRIPEEDNMSIGELIEWLQTVPPEHMHLPVTVTWDNQVFNLNSKRLEFTDGARYYSVKILETMKTAPGVSLEIDANPNY